MEWISVKDRLPDRGQYVLVCCTMKVTSKIDYFNAVTMAGKRRYAEFERWPKYRAMYVAAFDRMLEARRRAGKKERPDTQWFNGESVMRWWLGEDGAQILWEDLGL